MTYNTNKNIL